jgi:SAM-dependent methyltransferase
MAASERSAGRRFDRDHGVTTHAIAVLTDLDPERTGDACAHATHYEPVGVRAFIAMLGQVPDAAIRSSAFVDVGAGMGRAVLLATEYPFRQIVGIEVSPALAEIARQNLRTARDFVTRCRDVRIVRADARRHRLPAGDLVVFLYNPFDAQALEALLDRLAQRRNRGDEWLLYHTPVHAASVLARGYERVHHDANGDVYRRPALA